MLMDSRCPLPKTSDTGTTAASTTIHSLLAEHLQEAPVNATQVTRMTRTDSELARVYKYIMECWPNQVEEHLKVFFTKRNDLSTEQGCALWGTRVVVPSKMRKGVLKEIHSGHQGIVKTKALARKYVWWPKLDSWTWSNCAENVKHVSWSKRGLSMFHYTRESFQVSPGKDCT